MLGDTCTCHLFYPTGFVLTAKVVTKLIVKNERKELVAEEIL